MNRPSQSQTEKNFQIFRKAVFPLRSE